MRFISTIVKALVYRTYHVHVRIRARNRVTRVQHCRTSHSVLTDDQIRANFARALAAAFSGFAHISEKSDGTKFWQVFGSPVGAGGKIYSCSTPP